MQVETKKVFISHSDLDRTIVSDFIELTDAMYKTWHVQYTCTCLPEYSLEAGSDINQSLKAALQEADLILGFITPNSMASAYVLFELGGGWALDKKVIPLLCHPKGVELLRPPLNSLHAIKCYDRDVFVKFITREYRSLLDLNEFNDGELPLIKMVYDFTMKVNVAYTNF